MPIRRSFVLLILVAGIFSQAPLAVVCRAAGPDGPVATAAVFGKTREGAEVSLFTLTGPRGISAKVIELGGTLISLEVPDRTGKPANIVQGLASLDAYLARPSVAGAIVGRYANRISNARFTLDGVECSLTPNARPNHIHGGQDKCFHRAIWKGQVFQDANEAGVRLTYLSRDGDEGFPGNLTCTVTYSLTKEGDLKIHYVATTDKPTVVNMTNHSYFNLAGAQAGDVLGHEVMINASWYTPAGPGLIPTGEVRPIAGTPLDFTQPRTIGSRIAELTDIKFYDHNFVLNGSYGSSVLAARVSEPTSGRVMEVYTTEPGMQFYTGKGNAFCVETQHFPDSPNKAHFPSTVLRPDQKFDSTTVFKFSTK